jgi:hypothetical protein
MGARLAIGLAVLAIIAFLLWDRDQLLDQLALARSNVQTLQGAVEAQNTAILAWQAKAQAAEDQATAAARAVLQRRPPLPTGHGPAVMNTWLRETFTPTLALPRRGGGNFSLYFNVFTLSPRGRGEGEGASLQFFHSFPFSRGEKPESNSHKFPGLRFSPE